MAKYVDVEKVFCAGCEDRDRCGSPDVFCDVHSMPTEDVAPVVHGKWVVNRKSEDDYKHHMCNKCKTDAPFHYTYTDDYDEGFDGEWFYLGQREDDIVEHMGNFCPNCGADMRERKGGD